MGAQTCAKVWLPLYLNVSYLPVCLPGRAIAEKSGWIYPVHVQKKMFFTVSAKSVYNYNLIDEMLAYNLLKQLHAFKI